MEKENVFSSLEEMLSEFIELEHKKNNTTRVYQDLMNS